MSSSGSGQPANAAEAEFARYKARMGSAVPGMIPGMMLAMPGWALPPSLAPFPSSLPEAMVGRTGPFVGSIGERLGTTVRLGVELLNAVLASSAAALGGAVLAQGGECGRGECGCDCGCDCGCGIDCCKVMGCGCCRPGVYGCQR